MNMIPFKNYIIFENFNLKLQQNFYLNLYNKRILTLKLLLKDACFNSMHKKHCSIISTIMFISDKKKGKYYLKIRY